MLGLGSAGLWADDLRGTFNIIVKKHGGSMDVESRPGRTRFVVRLPVRGERPPAAR